MGNFFVNRPIVAMVIAIFMVIVGVVSLKTLPIEQYPDITPPVVEVRATYTGADSISVEQSVATPLEQEINGVENMIYMKSTNANDGTMLIQVSFEVGTDPDMNTVFTQNRVTAATAKLPEEVKRLGVKTEKSQPNILMLMALTAENGRFDQNFLGNYALINIKDVLARTRGIGRVNVMGASDYSMRIWIKPDRLAQLGITVPEIMNAIREQSVIVPGGKLGAEPAPPGTEFTYTVRLAGAPAVRKGVRRSRHPDHGRRLPGQDQARGPGGTGRGNLQHVHPHERQTLRHDRPVPGARRQRRGTG